MNSTPAATHLESTSSERRTAQWDIRNALRNYSTLVIAQVAVAFFSFASVWLVTRYLGTEGYGGIVAVIAASQIAQILINWTGISLARYGVEEFVETGQITLSFWARTVLFLPNTLILLAVGPLWLPFVAGWLKLPSDIIWFVIAHFVASAVWMHIQFAMQAAKLPRLQGILQAAERLLIFAFLSGLVLFDRLDVPSAISAYIAAPVLMLVIGVLKIRNVFSWHIRIDRKIIRNLLAFSFPLIPYSLIGYFSTNYIDAIFISQYLTKADLGVYSIAYQINGILMQFPLLAGALLLPLFVTLRSGGSREHVTTYLESVLPFLTLIGSLGCICAGVMISLFIPLIFGDQAGQSVIIFCILMSSAAFAIPVVLGFGPYTNAISATYVASILALVSALANLLGNYLLIPRYGLKGCAWATVVAYGVGMLTAIIIVRARFSLKHIWTLPACLPPLIASVYASVTDDLITAFGLALAAAFIIVLIWRKPAADGMSILKSYRTAAVG